MITEQALQEAIAECKGERNPNASTAIKLAAFLTLQREMFGQPSYSFAPKPTPEYSAADEIGDYGESEFLQAVKGKDPSSVWKIIDDLMDTLKMVNPRVFDGVMRKIKSRRKDRIRSCPSNF